MVDFHLWCHFTLEIFVRCFISRGSLVCKWSKLKIQPKNFWVPTCEQGKLKILYHFCAGFIVIYVNIKHLINMSYLKIILGCWSMVMLPGSMILQDREDQTKKAAKIAKESLQTRLLCLLLWVWIGHFRGKRAPQILLLLAVISNGERSPLKTKALSLSHDSSNPKRDYKFHFFFLTTFHYRIRTPLSRDCVGQEKCVYCVLHPQRECPIPVIFFSRNVGSCVFTCN